VFFNKHRILIDGYTAVLARHVAYMKYVQIYLHMNLNKLLRATFQDNWICPDTIHHA